jgi:2-polyprenyl-6-methoxyphenol hydroxylase-like FAD-dependent oxidoreductase
MPPGGQRQAEVVGAGIVGLGAATLLARNGWSVRVHERHRELREVGAAIGIKPGAASVLRILGVLDRVSPTIVLTLEERRDANGRVLQSRRLPGGARFYNPLRQDLVDALRDAAASAGAELRMHSTAVSADPAGTIALGDGTVAEADLVVAADGFRSQLRESLGLEKEARLLSAGTARVLMPREDEEPARLEYWSGKLRIGVAPTSDDLTYVYLNSPNADAAAARTPIDVDLWASRFPGLPRRFFERVHAAGGVRHEYPLVFCRSWVGGRVALVGDAAHALPSTLGIGASIGLVNAYRLVERVTGGGDVEQALLHWDRVRRPATVRTQHSARVYDAVTRFCPSALEPLRNGVIRTLDIPWLNARVLGLKAAEI